MCDNCYEKWNTSPKYIGQKYRVERWNESKSGDHDRWSVVTGEDQIMNTFPTLSEALESAKDHNSTFQVDAWRTFRKWFNSIDSQVKGEELRNDNPHLWLQMIGLRNSMLDVARATLDSNWIIENNNDVCNMAMITDAIDHSGEYRRYPNFENVMGA